MTFRAVPPGCVLVVDDNEDAAEALAAALRAELGCQVVTAYDGAEGLDKAGEFHPDVVVLDIGMPQVDGLEAASLLRRVFGSKTPRLIAVSGRIRGNDDERQAEDWGFDRLLGKPVDIGQLVRAVLGENAEPAGWVQSS